MTHFKNYNNTIDTLKQLGSYQFQIQTVTTGDLNEIDLEKRKSLEMDFNVDD